jgi:hypothetical protein
MEDVTRRDAVRLAATAGAAALGTSAASAEEPKQQARGGGKREGQIPPFVSAFTLGKIVQFNGKAGEARRSLEAALRERGIDIAPALRNLPEGEPGNVEAVSRLISLARGHGYFVEVGQMGQYAAGGTPMFTVSQPAAVGALQSGHHQDHSGPR